MAIDLTKHNFEGTSAPTTGDDALDGYSVGSRWIDTATDTEYICTSNVAGQATWAIYTALGIKSVAGLSTALGENVAGVNRYVLTESFTKRPFLALDVTLLTDSSGGVLTTPNTLADQNDAVTGSDGVGDTAALKSDVDARLVTIANNVGKLALKLNNMLAANADFEVSGTNMTSALVTLNGARGGVRLTTAGAASDQAILGPRATNANDSRWATGFSTDRSFKWAGAFRVTDVATIKIKCGLSLTGAIDLGTDADQVGIFFDAASYTYFKTFTSINGTDSSVADAAGDTAITPTADVEYRVRIEADAARQASIYVNDVFIFKTAALKTGVSLKPFISIESSDGAKVIDVRPMTASIVEV